MHITPLTLCGEPARLCSVEELNTFNMAKTTRNCGKQSAKRAKRAARKKLLAILPTTECWEEMQHWAKDYLELPPFPDPTGTAMGAFREELIKSLIASIKKFRAEQEESKWIKDIRARNSPQ